MENKGIFAFDRLQQLRHLLGERIAGVVMRPGDVRIVAPLLVPLQISPK